jgi:hypothetical protein
VNNPHNQKYGIIHENVNSTEETFRTDMTKSVTLMAGYFNITKEMVL